MCSSDLDAMVFCQDATAPLDGLRAVQAELEATGIDKPALVAVTKLDEARPERVDEISQQLGLPAIGVSVLDDESLDRLRDELWAMTGLVRVYLRDGGDPVALQPPATVLDVADTIHHELRERCTGARIWGPSARFPGQQIGREHELSDGDTVEILDR